MPKVANWAICPYRALKVLTKLYLMNDTTSVFQGRMPIGGQQLTDTRVRKALKSINMTLGLNPHFFTYHSFRRYGTTFAHNAHVPIQQIKCHGTWFSEWRYIQSGHLSGEELAYSLAAVINSSCFYSLLLGLRACILLPCLNFHFSNSCKPLGRLGLQLLE